MPMSLVSINDRCHYGSFYKCTMGNIEALMVFKGITFEPLTFVEGTVR